MKLVTFHAGMGWYGADHANDVTYTDEEFDGMTEDDLYQIADGYAQEYVDVWFEVRDL